MPGALRLYNLFPLLAGPIEDPSGSDWYSHLDRVAAMNFDWILLNPFHQPGSSGSLYAIKDPYALHPLVAGSASKTPERLLGDFLSAAGEFGLQVMMDLVVNRTSRDALLVQKHPQWYPHGGHGDLVSPGAIDPADSRVVTVWGDLAELDFNSPAARRGLLDYWSRYLRHYLHLGVRGFRCDAACQAPADFWAELITAARRESPGLIFVAETLGSTIGQVQALAGVGFDYLYNSAKWWDFEAPWLLSQYETFRSVAPSIAFPESHNTARLCNELGIEDPGLLQRHYRLRYAFAAAFSSGVMMPMGYEYGLSRDLDVVRTTPADWEQPRFDLSGFITEMNAAKAASPALSRDGPQQRLKMPDPRVLGLLQLADERGEDGCALVLINRSQSEASTVPMANLLAQVPGTYDVYLEMTPERPAVKRERGQTLTLEPLELRVLCGNYASARDHLAELGEASPSPEIVRGVVGADYEDPFAVRGMHRTGARGALAVRTFQPGAEQVEVIHAGTGKRVAALQRLHEAGFFAGPLGGRTKPFAYRLRISSGDAVWENEDPYRFPPVLGEVDVHLLGEGSHLQAFEKLGAHPMSIDGVGGTAFAVWAPNARRVAVVGDFNAWDGRCHPMRLRHGAGVWEIFLPGVQPGAKYKYEIKGAHGELLPLKSDPVAFAAEHPPHTASVVRGLPPGRWRDEQWMQRRREHSAREAPITIYEVHLGSWRRVAGQGNRSLSYRELAGQLIPYVLDMGFTHLELLPVTEHPFDGSWGYQPIGLFAPTSRFGPPEDFQYFMDACHVAGLGVLLDWVPGHFPSDPHGLAYFDGTHLYEHSDPRQGYHQDWNTLIYNYGRNEVANFLLSNARYWMERYHLDGLRVDAVASMLYLDYSRREDQWVPNRYGGRENLEAVSLLQRLNEQIYGEFPGVMTVAEESTAWPGVSRPVYLGGLGFGYKWNMGWMHDSLAYMRQDPIHRRFHHGALTFSLVYAFSENYVLPLSHDEVVHGKGSLLGKMPGDAWQQFANLRAYFGFMWTHPGKKLLFMGGEFAQGREWSHDAGLDWQQLDIPAHAGVQRLVRDLNGLYRDLPALHRKDCAPEGFEWIEANDSEQSVIAYLRRGEPADAPAVVACNFTPVPRYGYRIGVPAPGFYTERLNTDGEAYGGSGLGSYGGVHSQDVPSHNRPWSLELTLPPLATVVLEGPSP
jgi:1,4-alpha-glucan branching enzyme